MKRQIIVKKEIIEFLRKQANELADIAAQVTRVEISVHEYLWEMESGGEAPCQDETEEQVLPNPVRRIP